MYKVWEASFYSTLAGITIFNYLNIKIMENQQLLINLLFGGVLGMIGQGIRVIIGLKKLNDEAAAQAAGNDVKTAKEFIKEEFDAKKIWISLFIGFLAGCLASFTRDAPFDKDVQMAIIVAGYSGADFIEGIFRKYI
jgi:hypothetical protein